MAHGEMIAVGAYTCYVVQNLFGSGFGFVDHAAVQLRGKALGFGLQPPRLERHGLGYESYFLFALPLSFLMAALAGLADRAHGDPLPLSPPPGVAPGDLGHFPRHATMFPHGLRRK